jgi:hypothetical protein
MEWKAPGGMTVTMMQYYTGERPNTTPPECPVAGVVYVGHEEVDPMDGGFGIIRWKYMGGVFDGGGGGGDDYDEKRTKMTLEIWADQTPLTMHPRIKELISEYDGTLLDGVLTFPREDPTGSGRRKGIDDEGNTITLNPLYGVDSYFTPRASLKMKRYSGNPKLQNLGYVDDPPWDLGGKSNSWLKSGATSTQFGADKEVLEDWLFSNDGWEKKIYDPAKFTNSSS